MYVHIVSLTVGMVGATYQCSLCSPTGNTLQLLLCSGGQHWDTAHEHEQIQHINTGMNSCAC